MNRRRPRMGIGGVGPVGRSCGVWPIKAPAPAPDPAPDPAPEGPGVGGASTQKVSIVVRRGPLL